MDVFDRATELEEKQRDVALKMRKPTLIPAGSCHYCDSVLRAGLLFCDTDCRDDWQHEQDARSRNGS